MTIAEYCKSIAESTQRIIALCRRYPVSDLAKEAGLVNVDSELQDLVSFLEDMGDTWDSEQKEGD